MNHPNGPILAGKEVTTALFWPREEEGALNMSITAELGRGGGADQAEMQYWDKQRTKTMHAVKAEVYLLFEKITDYRTALIISALLF